jgi:Membrane proteins related to metalloendopeptidases
MRAAKSLLAARWLFAAASLVAAAPAFALDWPLTPPRLAANFGTPARGRLVTGVALASDEGLVRSSEDGELSFVNDGSSNRSPMPCPLGSFEVIEHKDGMAAVYSHLAPGSASSYTRKPKAGEAVGRSGSSGWAEGSGILFQVFDRKAASWVNPLLLLPPRGDDTPPVIRSLAFVSRDKIFVLGDKTSLPQGTYKVAVEVADQAEASWSAGPLAPYSIRLSIDGTEASQEVFDQAHGDGGRLMFFASSPVSSSELRAEASRYVLVERFFPRGRSVIEVRVEDAEGNKRSASWTLLVE